MWPRTRGLMVKVQVPQLVSRRLPASPQVTSLDFTRQQHSLPPLVDRMMRLVTLKDSSPYEDTDSQEVDPSNKEDEGLYIPSYLEEAIPDDPVLQVKVAHALQVQEMNSRRCFTCNRPGHLTQDHQEWEEQKRGPGPSS